MSITDGPVLIFRKENSMSEKIKYHDNINGPQYGPDGNLTDNWNPDGPFPADSYIQVYFRIDTKGASAYGGWKDQADRDRFHSEMTALFKYFGIPEGTGGRFENFPMEHLYAHPNDISGVVEKCKVKPIAEALDASESVSVRWVDVYRDVSPMSNAEYLETLKSQRAEIAAELLTEFRTKRSNLYIVHNDFFTGPVRRVAERRHVPRREAERYQDNGTGYNYVYSVFEELLAAGKIVSAETKHGTGYRTAKANERRSA